MTIIIPGIACTPLDHGFPGWQTHNSGKDRSLLPLADSEKSKAINYFISVICVSTIITSNILEVEEKLHFYRQTFCMGYQILYWIRRYKSKENAKGLFKSLIYGGSPKSMHVEVYSSLAIDARSMSYHKFKLMCHPFWKRLNKHTCLRTIQQCVRNQSWCCGIKSYGHVPVQCTGKLAASLNSFE